MEPTIYIIGCGGVGSWLTPKLAKLTTNIVLVDGDRLEPKNLDRQLFARSDIGRNKAEALSAKYNLPMSCVPEYFSLGSIDTIAEGDWLFCAADNAAARRACLQTADYNGARVIIGANEYTDAEAYYYDRTMRDGPHDPRRVYPSILTDNTGDPLAPVGCTGEAAVASPQLVLANDWASSLMLHLYWYHTKERDQYPQETWPVHHRTSFAKFTTIKFSDR